MSIVGKKLEDLKLIAAYNDKIEELKLSDYTGKRLILFFYPYDFTVICPSELNKMSDMKKDFEKENSYVLFVSKDSIYSHMVWSKIEREKKGIKGVCFPIVSDFKGELLDLLGLKSASGAAERATVILSKELEIEHLSVNADHVGRNPEEILRLIKAFNSYDENGELCEVL